MTSFIPRFVKKITAEEEHASIDAINLLDIPDDAFILLGEPGMGKTCALKELAKQCGGEYLSVLDFNVDVAQRSKFCYIDEFDQVDTKRDFALLKTNLKNRQISKFCVSSRAASWDEKLTEALKTALQKKDINTYVLLPLTPIDQLTLLTEMGATTLLDPATREDLTALLGNPQVLKLFATALQLPHTKAPNTLSDIYRLASEKMLAVTDGGEYSTQQLLEAAGFLCAVMLLGNQTSLSLADLKDLAIENTPALNQLKFVLSQCAVFEKNTLDTYQPIHRTVQEYLAAQYLHKRLSQDRFPASRLFGQVLEKDQTILTPLAGMMGWLASMNGAVFDYLVTRDIANLIAYVDLSCFSTLQKSRLLTAVDHDLGPAIYQHHKSSSTTHRLLPLVTPDMHDVVRQHLTTIHSEDPYHAVQYLLCFALIDAPAYPKLVTPLLKLARDDTVKDSLRSFALDAYLRQETDVTALIALLEDIRQGNVGDTEQALRGKLLTKLYPNTLTPATVFNYLTPSNRLIINSYTWFVDRLLIKQCPEDQKDYLLSQFCQLSIDRQAQSGRLSANLQDLGGSYWWGFIAQRTAERFEYLSDAMLLQAFAAIFQGNVNRWSEDYKLLIVAFKNNTSRLLSLCTHVMLGDKKLLQYRMFEVINDSVETKVAIKWYCKILLELEQRKIERPIEGCLNMLRNHLLDLPQIEFNFSYETVWQSLALSSGLQDRLQNNFVIDEEFFESSRSTHVNQQKPLLEQQRLLSKLDDISSGSALSELHQYLDHFVKENKIHYGTDPYQFITTDVNINGAFIAGYIAQLQGLTLAAAVEHQKLYKQNKYMLQGQLILCAAQLAHQENPHWAQQLSDEARSSLLTIYWCSPFAESIKSDWLIPLLLTNTTLHLEAWLVHVKNALQNDDPTITMRDMVLNGKENFPVPQAIVLRLLRLFPSKLSENKLYHYHQVLSSASVHCETNDLVTTLEKRLNKNLTPQKHAEMTQFYALLVAPEKFANTIAQVLNDTEKNRLWFIENLLNLNRDVRDGILGRATDATIASLILLLAPFCSSEITLGVYDSRKPTGSAWLTRDLFQLLTKNLTPEATKQLEVLAQSSNLGDWRPHAEYNLYEQKRNRLNQVNNHIAPMNWAQLLADSAPKDTADLKAIVIERLNEIQAKIKSSVYNFWKNFYKDEHGEAHKIENTCRDVLAERLDESLNRYQIHVTKEALVVNDKRTDIQLDSADRRLRLPIEVKGIWEDTLYTAVRDQLHSLYLEKQGLTYGIYLVLWTKHDQLYKRDKSIGVATPETLQAKLLQNISDNPALAHIKVFVLDISRPA
jgi:hypothetical protein